MDPKDTWSPKKAAPEPPARRSHPTPGPEAQRFLASMTMTYDMWREGLSYDLDTLRTVPKKDIDAVMAPLLRNSPRDWRDVEALALIDHAVAQRAVISSLDDPDPAVRRQAQKHAPNHINPEDRQRRLIAALQSAVSFAGLTEALAEAQEFHPPAVIDALFHATLTAPGPSAVHYAALLFYLHGKSSEPFDWSHRPLFLKFNEPNLQLRHPPFKELCQSLNIPPSKYLGNLKGA